MQPVTKRHRSPETLLLVAAVFLACSIVNPALAQFGEITGIVAGPFILAPTIDLDLEADSNVLNASSEFGDDTGDASASVGFGLDARMPFGNNLLEFQYSGASVEYDKSEFAGGIRQEGNLGLRLKFRTGDRLRIREGFLRDFSQILDSSISEQGPGFESEDKFFGSPYIYNRFDVEMERSEPYRIGYSVRIGRRDFFYEDGTIGTQYDYQGFDNRFEYYQPLSSGRRVLVHYSMRRLNNSRDGQGEFRKEVSDSVEAGLSGVGGARPFFFRVGYSRFLYKYPAGTTGDDNDNYRGLSGYARWTLPFGGRSALSLSLSRRPLPSSFDTFYVGSQFRGIAERLFRPRVKLALIGGVRQNQYADDIGLPNCDGLRRDWTWDAGFRASWVPHPMLELRLAGAHEQRTSNCRGQDFVSTAVNLGIRLGWF